MSKKYLILGASSDLAMTFIKNNIWNPDDEIICTCNNNAQILEENIKGLNAKFIIKRVNFLNEQDINDFIKFLDKNNFVPEYILHAPAVPIENLRFTELSWHDFDLQINVQVKSFMMIIQGVIKKMSRSKFGRVIVILSSCTLNVPPKFLAGYVTAKYALMGLVKSLASEYANKNILFNMLSPSMMQTKFLNNIYGGIITDSANKNPLSRNVTPEDLTELIKYLFYGNNFVTGVNIPISGGENF